MPQPSPDRPALRFAPHAWAKLIFFREAGPTEVGGFGIGSASDPLLIEDVALVRQACTVATVVFDDEAVADHFDRMVDLGLAPEQFGRVWIHTHPGHSADPSGVDEETFDRAFGACDWSVMAILARGGARYARLRFGIGPGGALKIPVRVDHSLPFAGSDHAAWLAEYEQAVLTLDPFADDADFFDPRSEDWHEF